MEQTNPKGAGFLKVCGILMIIGGALGIVLGITGLAGSAFLSSLSEEINTSALTVSGIIAIVAGALELVAGIIGIKNCKNPAKATTCIVWGIIVAVLSIVSQIVGVANGGSFNVISCITGLIIPILYIIGAVLNKKS